MEWIYFFSGGRFGETGPSALRSHAEEVYLRLNQDDKDGKSSGRKIILFDIIALDPLFEDKHPSTQSQEIQDIYHNELAQADFIFLEEDLPEGDEDAYVSGVSCAVKRAFGRSDVLNYIRTFFHKAGYPCTGLLEGIYEDFATDINHVVRLFSREKMRKVNDALDKKQAIDRLFPHDYEAVSQ